MLSAPVPPRKKINHIRQIFWLHSGPLPSKPSFQTQGTYRYKQGHLHPPRSQKSDLSSRSGWGSRRSAGCKPAPCACQGSPCYLWGSSSRPWTPPGSCWKNRGSLTPGLGRALQTTCQWKPVTKNTKMSDAPQRPSSKAHHYSRVNKRLTPFYRSCGLCKRLLPANNPTHRAPLTFPVAKGRFTVLTSTFNHRNDSLFPQKTTPAASGINNPALP